MKILSRIMSRCARRCQDFMKRDPREMASFGERVRSGDLGTFIFTGANRLVHASGFTSRIKFVDHSCNVLRSRQGKHSVC